MAKSKMREEMIDAFLNALQEGKIPWHREWSAMQMMPPRNAVKDTEYRGINRFWLFHIAERKCYSDPRWCTFKQARDNDWHVKKGEKGTHVEFWSLYDRKTKKTISDKEAAILRQELSQEEYAERVKPVANNYTVFNAEQIEGIPKLPEPELQTYELDEEELIRTRTVLLENMSVLFQEGGEKAFYRLSEDCIHLPEIKRFESEYAYMSTLLHEAGHATGHESRFDRLKGAEFGSPEYAKEELRAEIASAFTAQTLHFPQSESHSHMENHKAYVQSWIRILKNEPDELFRAIREAEKISDYLIEKGEFVPEHSMEKEIPVKQEKSFSEQVDEVLSGNADRYNDLKVCDTPQILLDAGCEQLPMLYTKAHLRKALLPKDTRKHNHGLEVEQIKKLPEYMAAPAMLIDSSTREDSIIIVFSALDNESSPLIATVRPNGTGTYDLEVQNSNFITSVYGRDNFEQFLHLSLENNKLLYWNKTKSQELFSVLGLQFPKGFNNLDYDIIIHQSNNIVKTISEKNEEIAMAEPGREASENVEEKLERVPGEKVTVAIESSEDYSDFNTGFATRYENGKATVLFRLVENNEYGFLVPYSKCSTVFEDKDSCQKYIELHKEELDAVGYDELLTQVFTRRTQYAANEGKLVDEVAQMERSLRIPFQECITEWFGDYSMYIRKIGVTEEDLLNRSEELHVLTEYTVAPEKMKQYGYEAEGMIPFPGEIAERLYKDDVTVYVLYPDNTESLVNQETRFQTGAESEVVYGVEYDDYQKYREERESLLNELAQMEKETFVPLEDRLSSTLPERMVLAPQEITRKELGGRIDFLKQYRVPVLSFQEVAKLRVDVKKGSPDDYAYYDSLSESEKDVLGVMEWVDVYRKQGLSDEEIVLSHLEEIHSRCGHDNYDYTKNLVCSACSRDRGEYYKRISLADSMEHERKMQQSISSLSEELNRTELLMNERSIENDKTR
ncbi:MAG: zincin-like metallopeptidase domain-containing protein [Roseburia sp.]|nr:zincin-like metallopeptidase domain-containing protein [Roseburia sp.]